MSSFAIDARARKTETLLRRYQIASVPTLIINGKYRTDAGTAGGYARLFQIVEYLIRKEQAEGAGARRNFVRRLRRFLEACAGERAES